MKKLVISLFAVFSLLQLNAQVFSVNKGDVTYAFPVDKTGDMFVTSGQTFTIADVVYPLTDITSMTVAAGEVADNTVLVEYNGTKAHVTIAGNLAESVTATVRGAHVSVIADAALADEVTYTLKGASSNGSFYMDGKYKSTFILSNLSLINPDSAAVNIQDGKRLNIKLVGDNTLTDGIKGEMTDADSHKACFYADGHVEFKGEGALTINGNVKHGFCSDEYCVVEGGNITVASAPSDAFHVGQYYQQTAGKVTLTSLGDGLDVGKKKDETLENNGQILLDGGELDITVTGVATKGLKAESDITITAGTCRINSSGSAVYDATEADISSSAGIKTDGKFTFNGGNCDVLVTGLGGKAVNATGEVTFAGGKFTAATCGKVFTQTVAGKALDTKSQGVKSDADIIINGGEVYVAASSDKGTAFKTDSRLVINAGTMMGIGAKASVAAAASRQSSKSFTGVMVAAGSTVTKEDVSFTVPQQYSNTNACVIVSK